MRSKLHIAIAALVFAALFAVSGQAKADWDHHHHHDYDRGYWRDGVWIDYPGYYYPPAPAYYYPPPQQVYYPPAYSYPPYGYYNEPSYFMGVPLYGLGLSIRIH